MIFFLNFNLSVQQKGAEGSPNGNPIFIIQKIQMVSLPDWWSKD